MDIDKLRQQGKIDQRCRACGRGEAAGAFCSGCYSTDLDLIPHELGKPCLASGRSFSRAAREAQEARLRSQNLRLVS